MIETDQLNVGNPAYSKNRKRRFHPDQLKSISLTRSSSFVYRTNRIVLDADKLRLDGYIPEPFDEYGFAVSVNGSDLSKGGKSTHWNNLKSVIHGLNVYKGNPRIGEDEEYEERIYKDILNIGKYIIYIDVKELKAFNMPYIINYIKKYPHIKVRKLDYNKIKGYKGASHKRGKESFPSDRCKVILDIDMIKKREEVEKNTKTQSTV